LQRGIGNTIRASLTPLPNGDRTEEALVCQQILQALGLRSFLPQVATATEPAVKPDCQTGRRENTQVPWEALFG